MLPSIWGPKLWTIIHGIGGKAGFSIQSLRADELRELKWLVNNLETIIPCQECQTHVKEYRKMNPPPSTPADYGRWFWEFHNNVNIRLGKPIHPFTPDLGSINVHQSWKSFVDVIGLNERGDILKTFGRHLQLWIGFAGI